MNVESQKIITAVSFTFLLAVGGGWYWLYKELHRVKDTFSMAVSEVGAPASTAATVAVKEKLSDVVQEQNVMKRQLWTTLQSKYKNAVCQIFSQITEFNWTEPYKTPNQTEAAGSGFFINEGGEIITNAHVVEQAILVTIQIPTTGKRRFKVEVLGVSPERDLALLRLPANELKTLKELLKVDTLPFLTMAESDNVQRGDKIMTLGYPLGQQGLKSTTGVVSGFEHLMGQYFIQIDAPINKGNSGGPSLDYRGFVIGVNSAGIQGAQNVGYIIPSNEVAFFLDQLKTVPGEGRTKLLRKPYLGVAFNQATENLTAYLGNPQPGGLYVVDIYKGSPFDKAGIQAGDMLYKINGNRLDLYGEMKSPWRSEDRISIVDYVSRLKLGDVVKLEYYRKGALKKTEFPLTQTEPPIRRMHPGYEKIDYEVLAGFVIMPITLNHVILLAQFAPELMQYADLKKQIEPALLITNVMLNSPVSRARTVGAGGVISEVNGQRVKTLQELREAVKKSLSTNYLTIKTTDNQFVALPVQEILDDEPRLASTYFYKLSGLYHMLNQEKN